MRYVGRASGMAAQGIVQLGNALAVLGGMALLALVIVTLVSVVARGVFGKAFMDVVTLGRIAMLLMGFLTAAYALRLNRHVAIDVVVERLPVSVARKVRIVGLLVALGMLSVTTVGTFQYAQFAMEIDSRMQSEMDMPTWPFQMIIPVGLAVLTAQLLAQIVALVRAELGERCEGTENLSGR